MCNMCCGNQLRQGCDLGGVEASLALLCVCVCVRACMQSTACVSVYTCAFASTFMYLHIIIMCVHVWQLRLGEVV